MQLFNVRIAKPCSSNSKSISGFVRSLALGHTIETSNGKTIYHALPVMNVE
jgi:hypothetical protein